jgi:hypothetical protein
VIVMMLLLTWLVVSVPVSLVLGRAVARGSSDPSSESLSLTKWRREPAAA